MTRRRISAGLWLFILLLSPALTVQAEAYRVQKGDSLYSISKKQGASINAIIQANNLPSDRLKPGQRLTIPRMAVTTAPTENANSQNGAFYIIKKGDTLSSISLTSGVPVNRIMALNDVNPKTLRIGRKLLLQTPQTAENPDIPGVEDEEFFDEEDESQAPVVDPSGDAQSDTNISEEFLGKWNNLQERKLLIKVATGFLGIPYKLGGASMKGMDCSAYVRKMYEFFDISLPRTAREQAACGVRVEQKELVEGDLVFFSTRKPIGHVGIYIGNNEFVHASYRAKSVRIDRLDHPYFQKRYRHAVRLKDLDSEGGA